MNSSNNFPFIIMGHSSSCVCVTMKYIKPKYRLKYRLRYTKNNVKYPKKYTIQKDVEKFQRIIKSKQNLKKVFEEVFYG